MVTVARMESLGTCIICCYILRIRPSRKCQCNTVGCNCCCPYWLWPVLACGEVITLCMDYRESCMHALCPYVLTDLSHNLPCHNLSLLELQLKHHACGQPQGISSGLSLTIVAAPPFETR